MSDKKFIDPYTEDIISNLAQDETGKRQYYRPVYSLHKWWARRPGSLFRSIILRAVEPHKELFIKEHNSFSHKSNYFQDHNLENIIILDPFMGGGTTLVEANRLGAKIIGCDLNPVSFWVVRETLKPIHLKTLNGYFKQLEETVGEKIKSLYSTVCIHCNTHAEGLYAFWVRYIKCLHCENEVYLFKRTLLNKGLIRNKPASHSNPATAFCPGCFALNDWPGEGNCICKSCGYSFDPYGETYDQGSYACFHCKKDKISLIQTLKTGQKLKEKLIAIEYGCPSCKSRLYKSPDEADSAKIQRIEKTAASLHNEMTFPRQEILPGDSSVRWRRHNYRYYHEVFNARQLLAFHYLIAAIRDIPEEEYRNAFFTVFSNALEYNNMMTPYNYPHRKLHHLFNYHAMPLTTTPVENAVWGVGSEGAGTFLNCYRRYVRAKEYCRKPFDKFKGAYNNSVQTVWAKNEKIAANYVLSFEELKQTPRGAMLFSGNSAHLPDIPDKGVDFVITDPPYFDSIHYSELSNFFYVWLHVLSDHPYFKSDHVPTEQEAIVNANMNKGEKEYTELLLSVFKECGRVLKDEGKLIFTFHHTQWRAWWTVLTAITESGFRVADYFPVMSEYKVNPHIRNKQALDMDLVLICQKRKVKVEMLSLILTDILERALKDLSSEISGNSDNKLFLHFMGELLRTAGSAPVDEKVDYDWFAGALTHFDDFVAGIERIQKEDKTEIQFQQLGLFESSFAE
jgi:adenine-specific DNA methylase